MTPTIPLAFTQAPGLCSAGGSVTMSLRWLTAIQESTQCLRDRPIVLQGGAEKDDQQVRLKQTSHCMEYLEQLENALQPLKNYWDQLAFFDPPRFVAKKFESNHDSNMKTGKHKKQQGRQQLSPSTKKMTGVESTTSVSTWCSTNRFAPIQDDDDDEEGWDDQSELTGLVTQDDIYEAGDIPTFVICVQHPPASCYPPVMMTMRRLMIRIVTAKSECFAYQAAHQASQRCWASGVKSIEFSLLKIYKALEIARYFQLDQLAVGAELAGKGTGSNYGYHHLEKIQAAVMDDMSIVEVPIRSLTIQRDRFVHKAQQAKAQLSRQLEAMWISRTTARLRQGEKKWKSNNPRRKSIRAEQQKMKERQLNEICQALEDLSQMDSALQDVIAAVDPTTLEYKAEQKRKQNEDADAAGLRNYLKAASANTYNQQVRRSARV